MNAKLTRQSNLAKHYARCTALGLAMGMTNPNGKKISLALLKLEHEASAYAVNYCNGDTTMEDFEADSLEISSKVSAIFGKLPPGFFVNGDPRGYALKIDNETPEGLALIESIGLEKDWGGYGILSPEI